MNPGDRVRVERGGTTNEGVVLPSSTSDHIVLKLEGGYNIGIDREAASVDVLETDVHEIGDDSEPDDGAVSEIEFGDDLPTISLISTGGTIASTVDYRTGAVTAQFTAEDVLRAVPELAGRANYRGRVVANILSEKHGARHVAAARRRSTRGDRRRRGRCCRHARHRHDAVFGGRAVVHARLPPCRSSSPAASDRPTDHPPIT